MKDYIVAEKELGPAHDYFAELFNARELIRCKDCKYYRENRFVCDLTKYASTDVDFCSWAERKEE